MAAEREYSGGRQQPYMPARNVIEAVALALSPWQPDKLRELKERTRPTINEAYVRLTERVRESDGIRSYPNRYALPNWLYLDEAVGEATRVINERRQQAVTADSLDPGFRRAWEAMLGYRFYMSPPIKHDPAERENALKLLETVAGKEKRVDAEAFPPRWIEIKGESGNLYCLAEGCATRVKPPKKRFRKRPFISGLCYELPYDYHPIDTMVAEILLIQTDEAKYLELANRM